MTDKPKALRLADEIERTGAYETAAGLRQLHEVNQALVEALERLTSAANDVDDGYLTNAINQAEAALAKAQGESNE